MIIRIGTTNVALASALAASIALVACSSAPPPKETTPVVAKTAAPPAPLACAAGTADCDNNRDNACEAALETSNENCGACGKTCVDGESCVAGGCRRSTWLSAADDHACVLLPSGEARCWGDNSEGDLGDGTKETRTTPVPVKDVAEVVSIRTSEDLGCAVLKSGKLACWKDGKTARVMPFMENVVDVAIRSRMFCAALKTGEVRCAEPRSGEGALEPEPSPELHDAIAVAGGNYHMCALRKTGEVMCWGDADATGSGVVKKEGEERKEEEDSDAKEKRGVAVKGISDAIQVAALRGHTCVVRKNGHIACWGRNWSGQLGDGTSDSAAGPVEVQFLTDATEVATGTDHTCALRKTGEVACWGSGSHGELGNGSRESSRGPVPVKGITDAIHIAAGDEFTCAMRKSGAVSCWGSAQRGRLGNGTKAELPEPVAVPGIERATAVALGRSYSCALMNGAVSCWGRGSGASYGDGKRDRGVPAVAVPGITDATDIWGSDRNVCALKKSGDVVCWRGGVPNAVDDAKENMPYNPIAIPGLGQVKTAYDTGNTSIALLKSGQATLWYLERGYYSEKVADKAQTQTISGLNDVVELAGDEDFACGVKKSGKVGCLRYSSYRTFDKKKPVKPTAVTEVPDLKDAEHIAFFSGEFCVVRKTGEVACFGAYALPHPEAKAEPGKKREKIEVRPIAGLKDATGIAVGGSFRCALLKSGEVSCWGSGRRGELGRGTLDTRFEPGLVKGLNDAIAIGASSSHACAVRKSGAVACWGSNEDDQVGFKDPATSPLPVDVSGLPAK